MVSQLTINKLNRRCRGKRWKQIEKCVSALYMGGLLNDPHDFNSEIILIEDKSILDEYHREQQSQVSQLSACDTCSYRNSCPWDNYYDCLEARLNFWFDGYLGRVVD